MLAEESRTQKGKSAERKAKATTVPLDPVLPEGRHISRCVNYTSQSFLTKCRIQSSKSTSRNRTKTKGKVCKLRGG